MRKTLKAKVQGYEVTFRKQVHGCMATCSTIDVWLERTVTLTVPPAIGMEVSQGEWEAKIEGLWCDLDRGRTFAFTEADKELYNAELYQHPNRRPIDEIVKEWIESGWSVRES